MELRSKVIVIWVDGLSSRYLQAGMMPQLEEYAHRSGLIQLSNMFGYLSVGGAIFTGLFPERSGLFCEFGKAETLDNLGTRITTLLRLIDLVPNDELRFMSRLAVSRTVGLGYLGVANSIPAEYLRYFETRLSCQLERRPEIGNGVTSVFDWLELSGKYYEYCRPPVGEEDRDARDLVRRIDEGTLPDLYVSHPTSLDILGHKYGPQSRQIRVAAGRADQRLGQVLAAVDEAPHNILCIVLSDHGMVPVRGFFEASRDLSRLPLAYGHDYLYFLDSTMIRFWFNSASAKSLVMRNLHGPGKFLSDKDLDSVHVAPLPTFYGDAIFALEEGWTVFPDFFSENTSAPGDARLP